MPRIANADEIKRAANIADIIGRRVVLHPAHGHLEGSCPFHASRSGKSFQVQPDKNTWYCWGCRHGGSALQFVMDFEKVDYHQALEIVAAECDIQVVYEAGGGQPQAQPAGPTRQDIMAALEAACQHYCAMLEHPEAKSARDYLQARGFNAETIRKYRIGYALEERAALLPNQDALLAAGVLRRNDYGQVRDPLSGRVTIPLCDQLGRPVAFTGRLIEAADERPKYINTAETVVFKKDRCLFGYNQARTLMARATTDRTLHIIEGQLKCIALLENGIPCVAPGGTGFSEQQAAMAARLAQHITVVPDPDQAGERAAARTASILRGQELTVSVGVLDRAAAPNAKDPDDLWAKGLPVQIKDVPLVDWLYSKIATGKVATVDEAARVTKEIVPVIQGNPLPAVAAVELRRLSTLSGLPESALVEAKTAAPTVQRQQPADPQPIQIDESLPPERMLIASILQAGPGEDPDWPARLPVLELPPVIFTCIANVLWIFRYAKQHGVSVSDALPMTVNAQSLPWFQYWLAAEVGHPTQLDCLELCEELIIEQHNNLAQSAAGAGLLDLSTLIQNWR